MRICIEKATKRILEMQSHAREGALIANAINAGYVAEDIEEREVDAAGYEAAKAEDSVEIAIGIQASIMAKLTEIDTRSVRSIREWVVKQANAPEDLKVLEAQAVNERSKVSISTR